MLIVWCVCCLFVYVYCVVDVVGVLVCWWLVGVVCVLYCGCELVGCVCVVVWLVG